MIVKGRLTGLIVAACLQASPIHAGTETQAWVTPQRPLADEASSRSDQGDREANAQVARMWFKAEWQIYASTFVTAPTQTVGKNLALNPALDDQLWAAVKNDSLAAYAKDNPSTVTPNAAP